MDKKVKEVIAKELIKVAKDLMAVKLPSEERGASSNADESFKSGFMSASKIIKQNNLDENSDAGSIRDAFDKKNRVYGRVKREFGAEWFDGWGGAFAMVQDLYATSNYQVAKKMGLKVAKDLVGGREGYTMKMTYETWDEESVELGDTDDRGWEIRGEKFDDLEELLEDSDVRNKGPWLGWSSSGMPSKNDWIYSQDDENFRTGERTIYNLFIERADGKPLGREEVKNINKELRI